MKTKFTSIAFVLSLFLLSCGSSNDDSNSISNSRWTEEEKGSSNDYSNSTSNSRWTEEEKAIFLGPCKLNAEMNVSSYEAENYCNCVLDVIMNKYATAAEADAAMLKMTFEDIMQLTEPCL